MFAYFKILNGQFGFDDKVNLLSFFFFILFYFFFYIFRDEGVVGGRTSILACVDDIPHLRQVVNLMFSFFKEFYIKVYLCTKHILYLSMYFH